MSGRRKRSRRCSSYARRCPGDDGRAAIRMGVEARHGERFSAQYDEREVRGGVHLSHRQLPSTRPAAVAMASGTSEYVR